MIKVPEGTATSAKSFPYTLVMIHLLKHGPGGRIDDALWSKIQEVKSLTIYVLLPSH